MKYTTLNENMEVVEEVTINPLNCQFFIMVPEHYNPDGSCKCSDPEHREMMMEWGYSDEDF